MDKSFRLFPEQASTVAGQVDLLYLYLVGVSAFFSVLIFGLVIFFAVKYRRKSENDRPKAIEGHHLLEVIWVIVPLALTMIMCFWGGFLFFKMMKAPADSLEVYVVGKQWMWKIQHPEGKREINELHVPVNRPVRLKMTSEDVIHSFYIPAFRIKQDVVPGRYNSTWFEATKVGEYHLFCAEYCGTKHSAMIGKVIVMTPAEYQRWLGGGESESVPLAVRGKKVFDTMRCATCHSKDSAIQAPELEGIWGQSVQLQGGGTAVVDETYVRESILEPMKKIVEGYQPMMPTYDGQVSEEELLEIIAYIRSLSEKNE